MPSGRAGPGRAGRPRASRLGFPGRSRSARTPRKLRDELRKRARVQLFGEVWNSRRAARASTSSCATATARCRARCGATTFERLGLPDRARWPTARRSSSPAARTTTRARARRRRRSPSTSPACGSRARATCSPSSTRCAGGSPPRGCSSRRSALRAPARCRGASASSPARAARRATTCSPACDRRGWAGRVVWAFAPVQDRHAAPAITRALQDLAAIERRRGRSSSRAAAGRSPTCSRSATRRCAGRSRCCACR